jgi:hypothetical protein
LSSGLRQFVAIMLQYQVPQMLNRHRELPLGSAAIQSRRTTASDTLLDCFVASAPRNDEQFRPLA